MPMGFAFCRLYPPPPLPPSPATTAADGNAWLLPVEGLYCKRLIQCLASSKILTPPHPLSARRVCNTYPPPLVRGEDTLAGWREGGGSIVWKTPDTALYSIICKYFVLLPVISLLLTANLGGYIKGLVAQTAQRLKGPKHEIFGFGFFT